jgi:hypothetical protein
MLRYPCSFNHILSGVVDCCRSFVLRRKHQKIPHSVVLLASSSSLRARYILLESGYYTSVESVVIRSVEFKWAHIRLYIYIRFEHLSSQMTVHYQSLRSDPSTHARATRLCGGMLLGSVRGRYCFRYLSSAGASRGRARYGILLYVLCFVWLETRRVGMRWICVNGKMDSAFSKHN